MRDLDGIRDVVQECIDALTNQVLATNHEPEPEYLTTREVAKITKYSVAALEAYRGKKGGPSFYRQGTNVRYRSDEVREWMEAAKFE
ncbi:putative DNA-binding transcriptional regulator AlpA [Sulfitobacter undariae]|uniref:Putative DNA-binding transcriptional regulator AlpA n=1 Tax=Sulfitobacter undariae TaxID=1563671 RepID=A0A7W6EBE5_9RHOB|nr:helix-turn-helix domain-containing protein [Sulfitobacter undariae]MBB3996132.1 putative DNA-binding transcriptional regulator AlpA [Sulfitobacter undariae]